MPSTLKLTESDPHDVFPIAPGIVPVAWADKVLADITRGPASVPPVGPTRAGSRATADVPAPKIDMTLRPTAANDIDSRTIPDIQITDDRPAGPPPGGSRTKSAITVFLFALCSVFAAAGWQHYGATARQMIAGWTPPFALVSSQPQQPTGLGGQSDTPEATASAQASAEDQTPPAPAQAPEAPAAAAPSTDAAQLQSLARDLAAMGQEVELLKATVAELKAARPLTQPSVQQSLGPDAKPSQTKTTTTKPVATNPPARTAAPPPRLAAVTPRRPMQAYPAYSAQTYPAQAYPPVQTAAPQPPQQLSAPAEQDDEPVIRPPMPLH